VRKTLNRLGISIGLALFLILPAGAATNVVLKNDGWTSTDQASCQVAFAEGEAAAVQLAAAPEQKTFQLKSVQVLVCDGTGHYELEIYEDAPAGQAAPGNLIWPTGGPEEFELTAPEESLAMATIDLQAENILIPGGLRVALRHAGQPIGGFLTVDEDGTELDFGNYLHVNDTWEHASGLIDGDFVIRATFATAECSGKVGTHLGTNAAENPFTGTDDDDVFVARGGRDVILALGDNDRACGGPGSDTILSGFGDDRLLGDAGNDELSGGGGGDVLRGGDGDDELSGGGGTDKCIGGGGNDTFSGCETKKQ
jgi:hypothetical protein